MQVVLGVLILQVMLLQQALYRQQEILMVFHLMVLLILIRQSGFIQIEIFRMVH